MIFECLLSSAALFVAVLFRYYVCILKQRTVKARQQACRTMIILGSGGHTAEMLKMTGALPARYAPRHYVVGVDDELSMQKAATIESNRGNPAVAFFPIRRARRVGESKWSSAFSVMRSLSDAVGLFNAAYWPDLILCNGPGICVPICLMATIIRILGLKDIRVVYVESFARVKRLSLTGRIMYWLADEFLVQWPTLSCGWVSNPLGRAKHLGPLI